MIIETKNKKQTEQIGINIGRNVKKGQILCINGELGVGKTVITKGIAKGLCIDDNITSPTFTIVNEYDEGNMPMYHFDVYRISDPDEMYEIGFEDYLFGNGICVIEWAEIIEDIIPDNSIWINISKDLSKGLEYRLIEIKDTTEFDLGVLI